jgi:hypothetical protein
MCPTGNYINSSQHQTISTSTKLMLVGLRARVCMHPYDGAAVATRHDCKQTNKKTIESLVAVGSHKKVNTKFVCQAQEQERNNQLAQRVRMIAYNGTAELLFVSMQQTSNLHYAISFHHIFHCQHCLHHHAVENMYISGVISLC